MNRGKDFEAKFREQMNQVFDVTRLADNTAGYMGGRNICDFIVYRYPNLFYLELKTTKQNTLNFHDITDTQWNGLIEKEPIEGVGAGIVVWFIKHDKTFFISAAAMQAMKSLGLKSFNIKDLKVMAENFETRNYFDCFEIKGQKKRVFFEYDMKQFLSDLEVYLNYGQ
jgi:hypothetical protein